MAEKEGDRASKCDGDGDGGGDGGDSGCSTPYVSAPSSPSRGGYFFSAPASPTRFSGEGFEFEFEFSSRFAGGGAGNSTAASMISADELFLNGQIRPMNLSLRIQRSPPSDLPTDDDKDDGEPSRGRELTVRSGSMRRKARSMSPLRIEDKDPEPDPRPAPPETTSACSSRSSSTSSRRHSKRWVFLKDLLYRSKSEGRADPKDKFWNVLGAFSAAAPPPPKPANAAGKRRSGSSQAAHVRHYTANRAQAEEMRKKTFLPYRQGLLGCLWFSSRSYGTVNGLARALHPVPSR
ncbi:stress response NST1-like protein (DUF1645) [Wolffia australiana]